MNHSPRTSPQRIPVSPNGDQRHLPFDERYFSCFVPPLPGEVLVSKGTGRQAMVVDPQYWIVRGSGEATLWSEEFDTLVVWLDDGTLGAAHWRWFSDTVDDDDVVLTRRQSGPMTPTDDPDPF